MNAYNQRYMRLPKFCETYDMKRSTALKFIKAAQAKVKVGRTALIDCLKVDEYLEELRRQQQSDRH